MKSIFKKLKSADGESLIESLVAILVFTMASIVMYSMVSAAANINMTAKEMDEKNQHHMVAVEKGSMDVRNGGATVTFTIDGTTFDTVNVDIYGGKEDSLFAYFIHNGEGDEP